MCYFVPGSRRYADPGAYLFAPERWQSRRDEFCALVGKPADGPAALEQGLAEFHAAVAELERTLAAASPDDIGAVRLDEQGRLVIPPLSAEDIPAEANALKQELAGMLPFAPIASLLIELDHRTGFLSCFTHAGGHKRAMSAEAKRNILAVLIANATNLGLVKMAEACGVPYEVLAWTQEWYVREDTLREANTMIVNHHHRLELAKVFGGGTMSSSDGQRFPTRGKTITARAMNVHFAEQGLSTYTHVSDQHSTFGTKVIVPTHREAHYVLDDFLGNATDLPIREHATDTHGVTLVNFALFDLVGKALTPRIRDPGKITLCRDETPAATTNDLERFPPWLGRPPVLPAGFGDSDWDFWSGTYEMGGIWGTNVPDASAPYADYNIASDGCDEIGVEVGIDFPRQLAQDTLYLAFFELYPGTQSASRMAASVSMKSNDCNDLGLSPQTDCMGLNTDRDPPAGFDGSATLVNAPRNWTVPACFLMGEGFTAPIRYAPGESGCPTVIYN